MQYLPYISIFLIIAGSLLVLAGLLIPKDRPTYPVTPEQLPPETHKLPVNKETDTEDTKALTPQIIEKENPKEQESINIKPSEPDNLEKFEVIDDIIETKLPETLQIIEEESVKNELFDADSLGSVNSIIESIETIQIEDEKENIIVNDNLDGDEAS